SQFFVVTSDGVNLPPDYAVLGDVTKGMDVVEEIGKLGNPSDPAGTPTEKVTIDKMELESGSSRRSCSRPERRAASATSNSGSCSSRCRDAGGRAPPTTWAWCSGA